MPEKIEQTIEPDEARKLLASILGAAPRAFADWIGVPESRVREGKLDLEVVDVLRRWAAFAEANPFPVVEGWRAARSKQRRAKSRKLRVNRLQCSARNDLRVARS